MLKLHCEQDLNYLLNKEVRARDDVVRPSEAGGKGAIAQPHILADQLTLSQSGEGVDHAHPIATRPHPPPDFHNFLRLCIVETGAATGSLSLNCIQPCLIKLS